ncbi:MAG: MFS transporter [Opitutae bacterium]|nr:MFS transporter [Opitutales bacterium]MDB2311062.1 MFS transporter [Opitutales bacterium]MDG1667711.1 MFS transporter [Opitutae bacterium]MDG2345039.1 MFS transporter [Opitutae bacterium]
MEAGWSTFALLIAIRHYGAPESYKAFIAAAWPIGFLLTPLTLHCVAKRQFRPSLASASMFALAALLMLGATVVQSLTVFTAFIIASQMATVQQGPLMIQIYAENYPASERGKRMTTPFILTASSMILFSLMGGWLLDRSINSYHLLFVIMVVSAAVCAWATNRMPSTTLSTKHVGNPWQNFSLIWKDKLFGYLLGSWMLLGLGNLITMPIRVEYLANPKFGINADNTSIAFLLVVVPAAARILSTKLWGNLFDQLHFITIRNLLNILFLLGIAGFFFTTNIYLLTFAMILVGLATGGGKIIWSLWVTRIASHEKVSSYMSIHMALTGFRGTLAPFIGYWILSHSAHQGVAYVGMVLIAISIALFECVRHHKRFRH